MICQMTSVQPHLCYLFGSSEKLISTQKATFYHIFQLSLWCRNPSASQEYDLFGLIFLVFLSFYGD